MQNVIGYIRVSTEEQADSGAGLSAQRAAILAEAELRGWHVVDLIEDAGYSAKDLRRPGIQVALEALKRHAADALVVAKLDRLSRSMLDFSGLMDRASREHWALVALDLRVDTTTPAGEAMANMMATFAQLERRLIGQRTKDALRIKKSQGASLGRPVTLSAEIVARIVAERAGGATLASIADRLNADGVPTAQGGKAWWAATVRKVASRAEAPENDAASSSS
jgi:DNA invertase Pin-like site-specific DNA recombinase